MRDVTQGGRSGLVQHRLGVDLGKTKIAAGIVDVAGRTIVARSVVRTDTSGEGARLPSQLFSVIAELLASTKLEIQVIGIASFGMVDSVNGVVFGGKWLPAFRNVPLGTLIRDRFGVPVRIENDVLAAAVGEYWYGLGNGQGSMTLLSLGTSVGLASVIEGELIRGTNGRAGQIAHMPFGRAGAPSISDLIGGAGLARQASQLTGIDLTSKTTFESAAHGDERLGKLISEWIDFVGQLIGWIVCVIDPSLIVVTGGLFESRRDLLHEIHANSLRTLEAAWPCLAQPGVNLLKSNLGTDAALLGVTLPPESNL